jgi:hypothetical protein
MHISLDRSRLEEVIPPRAEISEEISPGRGAVW